MVQPFTDVTSSLGYPDSPLLFFRALTMEQVWEALETGRGAPWIRQFAFPRQIGASRAKGYGGMR